ncbi:MAG: RICIN domain-containing protein [Lachnospiraceae bacterium]|nr:RICIN domain-containing protein [Lachnospiraceae bacterium]
MKNVSLLLLLVLLITCMPIMKAEAASEQCTNPETVEYAERPVNGGLYMIVPKCAENSCLANVNGNLEIVTQSFSENEMFYFRDAGNGYYEFISLADGRAIDVQGGESRTGNNLQLYERNSTDAQLFRIGTYDEYYFFITKLNKDLVFDVAGGQSCDYTNVRLYDSNCSSAQLFSFYSVYVDDNIYMNQQEKNTCTLASATNMLRKLYINEGLSGVNNENLPTESELKKVAWNKGLKNNFKYNGYSITNKSLRKYSTEEKKEFLIDMLLHNPEGIVLYTSDPHAVLLVDYDGALKVYDPWKSTGVVTIEESTLKGDTEYDILSNVTSIWYVK